MADYIYNGFVLPALPERDEVTYPYVIICEPTTFPTPGRPLYFIREYNFYRDNEFDQYRMEIDGEEWILNEDANEWTRDGTVPNTGFSFPLHVLVWANFDVLNEDGTIFLPASDPVPVSVLTARDLYHKINGKPTKLTLYKKLGGKLIPLDEHTKEVKT